MAEGTGSINGLAVPLYGEFELKQRTAATDIMTITGATGQTGDFIVAQGSTGTEVFSAEDSGRIVAADWPVFSVTPLTTAPTSAAGLVTAGQCFWYDTANLRTFGVATSATSIWSLQLTNN
jgi:hypothetical protein